MTASLRYRMVTSIKLHAAVSYPFQVACSCIRFVKSRSLVEPRLQGSQRYVVFVVPAFDVQGDMLQGDWSRMDLNSLWYLTWSGPSSAYSIFVIFWFYFNISNILVNTCYWNCTILLQRKICLPSPPSFISHEISSLGDLSATIQNLHKSILWYYPLQHALYKM